MINTKGLIQLYQGDTLEIIVEGLDTTENYSLYFGVQNKHRVIVIPEFSIESNYQDTAVMVVPAEATDKLTVPLRKEYEDYYYGFKICKSDEEITLFVDDGTFGSLNILRIYPKKVEGV